MRVFLKWWSSNNVFGLSLSCSLVVTRFVIWCSWVQTPGFTCSFGFSTKTAFLRSLWPLDDKIIRDNLKLQANFYFSFLILISNDDQEANQDIPCAPPNTRAPSPTPDDEHRLPYTEPIPQESMEMAGPWVQVCPNTTWFDSACIIVTWFVNCLHSP